ncbi:hypothetical protein PLESTB_001309900 [Pleodorina starrii]|uniref:Uncharacterized protein n=1 Tax=Pleodorina starrii TaxID=330485 RepID=A0A9W6BV30_9CHLO|nr:hypothetical protein PLESTM_001021700 [Pleodorina starrii]GLC58026.1 hypothetical protein PLESTB_001309900 [Pleodorina starrii]GLC69583.1 hypothetical protein PLESTF_000851200 [Pleodorina starrii]
MNTARIQPSSTQAVRRTTQLPRLPSDEEFEAAYTSSQWFTGDASVDDTPQQHQQPEEVEGFTQPYYPYYPRRHPRPHRGQWRSQQWGQWGHPQWGHPQWGQTYYWGQQQHPHWQHHMWQ